MRASIKILASILLCGISVVGNCQEVDDHFLIARNTGKYKLYDSTEVRVFGFTQSLRAQVYIPGPTIDLIEGDSVEIDLWNVSQGAPHTIHLHGLDVNQQNDGVPHLSFDVKHMEHGYYRFIAPHSGTYLYHCHVASSIHVQAGMYGLVIVRPEKSMNRAWVNGPEFTEERSLVLSEIDTNWHRDTVLEHHHDTSLAITPLQIPPYDPQYCLINGRSNWQLEDERLQMSKGGKYYIRIANVGFLGNEITVPSGLSASIISSDGRPLPQPEDIDTFQIYPGERYGLMLSPSDTGAGYLNFRYFNLNNGKTQDEEALPFSVDDALGIADIRYLQEGILYPNPATAFNEVMFNQPCQGETCPETLTIRDMMGRVVTNFELTKLRTPQAVEFRFSGLRAGVYLIQTDRNHTGQKLIVY